MGSYQSLECIGRLKTKEEIAKDAGPKRPTTKKKHLFVFKHTLIRFLQRMMMGLSELDPMIPLMLSLLISRDGSSFDRQAAFIGGVVVLLIIEEVI